MVQGIRCSVVDHGFYHRHDFRETARTAKCLKKSGERTCGFRGTCKSLNLLGEPSSPKIQSLVVLQLENLSKDPEEEYFTDGMTDQLITNLTQIGALRGISRTSAMRYKGTKKSLPEIARELQVDAVVEGAVMWVGGRVRISAQLIEAPTDHHVWAASYERDRARYVYRAKRYGCSLGVQPRPLFCKNFMSLNINSGERYKGRHTAPLPEGHTPV